jgi:hypothetical protein
VGVDSFSSRYGYAPDLPGEPIVEDAPKGMRFHFFKRVLQAVTYVDGDSRYANEDAKPLGIKRLGEDLFAIAGEEPPPTLSDSWFCYDEVKQLLQSVEWFTFYDFVEHIGKRLLRRDREWFPPYQKGVNQVFKFAGVAWRLMDDSTLVRERPEEIQAEFAEAEQSLEAEFPPALAAFRKARRFLEVMPLDPENAIKEIVSAIESVGRTIYPGTATLGDVVKEMRKSGFPQMMVTIIEKFYAFASATPAVRHGGPSMSGIELADADFCLHVGTALINYILKARGT